MGTGSAKMEDGSDPVEWMQDRGIIKSSLSPGAKRMYYDRLHDRNSDDDEEHF